MVFDVVARRYAWRLSAASKAWHPVAFPDLLDGFYKDEQASSASISMHRARALHGNHMHEGVHEKMTRLQSAVTVQARTMTRDVCYPHPNCALYTPKTLFLSGGPLCQAEQESGRGV